MTSEKFDPKIQKKFGYMRSGALSDQTKSSPASLPQGHPQDPCHVGWPYSPDLNPTEK